ncbi:elongation factor P hydroxylase [Moritella sp. 36]|uniref:elongation factor P hydroxylase n=1 Tax=Moritella sp. 36 TaxID=2746233 RepID=UPI001BA5DDCD|nr:elongation factor P hydroxylase [Moritella sp. 36]QUM88360.1 elongation factor P hydroxylase [Moritella sp. 36]
MQNDLKNNLQDCLPDDLHNKHHYQDLIRIFNHTFSSEFNTQLVKGDDEPIYMPMNTNFEQYVSCDHHRIIFAHGFFSSGMHEISHWLVAGLARHQLVDFGYWYIADGRNAQQQAEFEKVEIVPQAIEWIICVAAGAKYRVSVDNVSDIVIDRLAFQHKIHKQVQIYLEKGLSTRTQALVSALKAFYKTKPLTLADFDYRGMYEC